MGIFSSVGGANPRRTAFDLSYEKDFNCNFGQLIPVLCEEAIPGDSWRIGNSCLVRFEPQAAPFFSSVWIDVHYFFVPYRIIDENWELFITGGPMIDYTEEGETKRGQQADVEEIDISRFPVTATTTNPNTATKYDMLDYLGFPLGISLAGVMDHSRRAINKIWNEFYRDENLQLTERSLEDTSLPIRNWKKDYFTSALPDQQKGVAPSFPLAFPENLSALFPKVSGRYYGLSDLGDYDGGQVKEYDPILSFGRTLNWYDGRGQHYRAGMLADNGSMAGMPAGFHAPDTSKTLNAIVSGGISLGPVLDRDPTYHRVVTYMDTLDKDGNRVQSSLNLNDNHIDLSDVTVGFDISDLRFAFQVQRFMERNARAGNRYVEFLKAQFGVSPRDDRLQRPEYLGSTHQSLVTSEVLQTSASESTSTKQGHMAGHSMSYGAGYACRYFVQEFGVVVGLMSVMTKAQYYQGVNRQWLRKTRYDFYNPLFANLSEQGIYNGEIYWQGKDGTDADDDYGIFGFQGIFDEMRVKQDMVCADMRPTVPEGETAYYNFWTLARSFAELPTLSSNFIQGSIANPRIFAVTDAEHPQINVQFGNLLRVARPMPYIPEPGLIDHH